MKADRMPRVSDEDMSASLRRLAALLGVESGYWDIAGKWHALSDETCRAIVDALGYDAGSRAALDRASEEIEESSRGETLPPVVVCHREELPLSILILPPSEASSDSSQLRWEFFEEGGSRSGGTRFLGELAKSEGKVLLNLPLLPKDGYHYLRVSFRVDSSADTDCASAGCRIIVCPNQCYVSDSLLQGKKLWGVGVQIPALRSSRNWGIGDLTDLRDVGKVIAAAGGSFIGINPLHSLPPGGSSPYSPSSRFEIQPLAIDLEAVPEFLGSEKVKAFLKLKATKQLLGEVQGAEFVDFARVWKLKQRCLRILFDEFRDRHLKKSTDRAAAFQAFTQRRGERLRLFALHSALADHFVQSKTGKSGWAWTTWPIEYQDPFSAEVYEFAVASSEEILFYQYQAWVAESQLADAIAELESLGVELRCYGDLALGVDAAGAESWIDQRIFVRKLSLGAPPDALGPEGQVWGLPAVSPKCLREEGYEPFAALIRCQMERAGALRLDHVMSLYRLFLIPQGMPASAGAYLRYPLHDLMAIVALESHRNRTVVIGEDLGTVPEEVSNAMRARRVLSYKVLYFMSSPGYFVPAEEYPPLALVVTSTHDLPTLRGFIEGEDIKVRQELGALHGEAAQSARDARGRDIEALRHRLQHSHSEDSSSFNSPVHEFLSTTPCLLQLIQLEDLIWQKEQYNVPGTVSEQPNWKRRYSVPVDELAAHPTFLGITETVRRSRA